MRTSAGRIVDLKNPSIICSTPEPQAVTLLCPTITGGTLNQRQISSTVNWRVPKSC